MLTSAKASVLKLRRRHLVAGSALGSSSGQAAIEFVLVMVITVGIVAGLIFRFNKSFGSFAKNLLGSYVICLLDNGELPGLGSDSTELKCAPPQFAFNDSIGADGPGGAGGSSSSSGSSSGKNGSSGGGSGDGGKGSSKGGGKKPEGTKAADAGGGGGGGGGGYRGSGGDPFLKSSRRKGQTSAAASGEAETDSTGRTGKMEFRNNAAGGSRELGRGPERPRRIIASFAVTDDGSNIDKDRAKKLKLGPREQDELRPNRMRLEASAKKTKQISDDESDFSFADLMRYILIAAIIIVLVIFIGGQAMSVSKSWEKN